MNTQEYSEVLLKISDASVLKPQTAATENRVSKTLTAIWAFLNALESYIFKDGVVRTIKWYDIVTLYYIAIEAIEFIKRIVTIWKDNNKN